MATKLEQFAELQPFIQKEIESQFEALYKQYATKYGVASVPLHKHNGLDAPIIPPESFEMVSFLPAGNQSDVNVVQNTGPGVANESVLGNQIIDNPVGVGRGNPSKVPTVPLPIIYGQGTTTAITFTGTPSIGATSATLTGAWGGATGTFAITFGSTEIRNVSFTNASTAVTWVEPLKTGAVTTGATVIADSNFKGGDAPFGTQIVFRNDNDGIYQLWVKTDEATVAGTWLGFNADFTILGYD